MEDNFLQFWNFLWNLLSVEVVKKKIFALYALRIKRIPKFSAKISKL
jgi:hypothetical protein